MFQEKKLEKMIADAVKARILAAPPPDLERIWAGINRKIRRQRAIEAGKRVLALAAVLILFAGFYSIFNPEPVRAIGKKVWYSFGTIFRGHIGNVTMSYTDSLGPNPPEQPCNVLPQLEQSLAAVAAKCPFKLLVPGYLPHGFTLSQVKYYPEGKGFARVELYYTSGEKWLLIVQWKAENQGIGYSFDTDDTVVSDVTVRGNPGKLYYRQSNGGYSQLTWAEGDRNYRIGGTIGPSEIERVASSLRELN